MLYVSIFAKSLYYRYLILLSEVIYRMERSKNFYLGLAVVGCRMLGCIDDWILFGQFAIEVRSFSI